MTEAVVRRAGPADVTALVELRAAMFAAMSGAAADEVTDTAWREQARAWFAARLDDAAYALVVVEVDGEVVSCAVGAVRDAAPSPAAPQGRDVLVSNVCTAAEHRGRGYGRLAFAAVMDWARETGVGRAELMATADGRAMYEQVGFRPNPHPVLRARLDEV